MKTKQYCGKGSMKVCFKENKDKKCFLMYEQEISPGKKTNTYFAFRDLTAFREWRRGEGKIYNKCWYELIKEGQPCIEYYDIDARTDKPGIFEGKTQEEIAEEFIRARLEYQEEMLSDKNIPLRKEHFLITSTPGKGKVSLHIYIRNNYYFENNHIHLKDFVNSFKEYCEVEQLPIDIDMSVYSRNRAFRLINNHKYGQENRVCVAYNNKNKGLLDFYATYLTNKEKLYFKEEVLGETNEQKVKVQEIYKDTQCNEKLQFLLKFIEETIADGSSPLCDDEFGNKICYKDYIRVSSAFMNECQEIHKPLFFSRIFNLYRRKEDADYSKEYDKLKDPEKNIGIRSIHYWAKCHPEYEKHFKKELEEYNKFLKEKIYDWKLAKAKKIENDLIIEFAHQLRTLTKKTKNKPTTRKGLVKTIKYLIKYVYAAGQECFYIRSDHFDIIERKRVCDFEYENRTKFYSQLGKGKIIISYVNENYKRDKKAWIKSEPIREDYDTKKAYVTAYTSWIIKKPKMIVKTWLEDMINELIVTDEIDRYTALTFEPYLKYRKEGTDNLNLFTGYSYSLDCGGKKDIYINSLFRENVCKHLCDNNMEFFNGFEKFVAHAIQKPLSKCSTMFIFSGKQGTGKDLFYNALRRIVGMRYTGEITGMNPLFDKFNKSLDQKLFIRINEIKSRGKHFDKAGDLKDIIDREYISIEPKGKEKYVSYQCTRFIGFSNDEDIVKVEYDDRRFNMITTNNDKAQNKKWFSRILKELNEDFYKSMFMYFATLDISDYNPCIPISTKFKQEQVVYTEPKPILFLKELFKQEGWKKEGVYRVSNHILFAQHYICFCEFNNHELGKKMSKTTFEKHIRKVLGKSKKRTSKDEDGKRPMGYTITYDWLNNKLREYYRDPTFEIELE